VANPFEARTSRFALNCAIIGAVALSAMLWCLFIVMNEAQWTAAIGAAMSLLAASYLLARRFFDFPVVQINEETIVFRSQLFPFVSNSIPLNHIRRAHSFWQDSSSREDSLSLVIELRRKVVWNRLVLNGNITPKQRNKFELPSNETLLEFPCSNCSPPPKVICQAINDRLNPALAPCQLAWHEPSLSISSRSPTAPPLFRCPP
jgi:hypothetical protein